MSLNNINLAAYAFNPFGALSSGFLNGYNTVQNAQMNKLKSQLMAQQMQSAPILNNLRQSDTLKNYLSNYAGIDALEQSGKISKDQAMQARKILDAQQNNLNARTASLNNVWRNMPAQIKENYLASGGNPEDFSITQLNRMNNQLTPKQNENFNELNKKSAEKKITPAQTQQQIDYSTAFHTAANTITDEDINSLYDPRNRLKYHTYDIQRLLNPYAVSPEGYDNYQEALSKMKNLKALYTKAVRGSVGVTAQKLLNQLLDPSIISNPQQGKDRIKALVDQLDLETQTLKENVGKPFSQEESMTKNTKEPISFKTSDELKQYYLSLSPQQKIQFRNKYGG